MTDRELERNLADAVARTAPDDLDAILSRCGAQNGSVMKLNALEQRVIDVDAVEVKSKKKWGRWLAAACAALVLVGGGGGVYYHQTYAVASVVSLDVNPSIELKVNRNERVISCTALNTEAAAVLFSMDGGADLKGTKLDVAVNAIVGALVREGYLDSISSAILISVEDNDQARAARLQAELVASVDGVLRTQAPGTSVLSQVLTMDALEDPALEYMNYDSGLSAGKAALVRRVMEMNGTLALNSTTAFDQLAALSVEELSDLLKTGETRIPIGKNEAAWIVSEYSGTTAINSAVVDVDPELDDIPPHYDVELHTAWGEFEYEVDAFTGEVLSGQPDLLNRPQTPAAPDPAPVTTPDPVPVTTPDPAPQTPAVQQPSTQKPAVTAPPSTTEQDVGQDAAKRAALNNVGLSESDVSNWDVKREWNNDRLEYRMTFWCGNSEYDCTVDGYTCSVLKCGVDHHTSYSSSHHSSGHHSRAAANASTDIGQVAAKAAALNHAGVSESQTTNLKVTQDWDDGYLEYEVEFKVNGMEYEYKIDGVTGAILEYESEWDD